MIVLFLLLFLFQQQQPGRPTNPGDPMPEPNLDYFLGTWTFDWTTPETPLGPGGKFKGKETYKKIFNGNAYESVITGESPEGPFEARAIISHNKKERTVTRYEVDSLGMSTAKTGPVGGDLGGYYTIFWEASPIVKNGKTIRLKGKTLMLSPANYRVQMQISVDGGPWQNLGSPWYRKEGT